jgi:hypothetical protein
MRMIRTIFRRYLLLGSAVLLALSGIAPLSAQASDKGYGRMFFAFDAPTRLKAGVAGTTATLTFNDPVRETPEAIRTALPGYITDASLSSDKRTLTLTLAKPYRIRQFVSGTRVGIDLIGEASAEAQPPPTASASNATAAEAAPAKAEEPTPSAPTSAKAAKPTPKPPAAAKPKAAPPAAAKKPKPTAPVATSPSPATSDVTSEDAMLTTRAATAPSPTTTEPVLSTKEASEPIAEEAKTSAASNDDMLSTKSEAPSTAPETAPEHSTAEASNAPDTHSTAESSTPAPAVEEAKPAAPAAPTAFVVGASTTDGVSALTFPWQQRTAAAVYRRGNDLWIIFSRKADATPALLRTVLPKQVIDVTQFDSPAHTVLRLTTDGSLFAQATQMQGSYGWKVSLLPTAPSPALDTASGSDTLEGALRLILNVFDVATPLRFVDPVVGDALVVVPAYENARGIAIARRFPEFELLASPQGIIIVSKREDLDVATTRGGLILSAPGGLLLSETLPIVKQAQPLPGTSLTAGVMMPYEQWVVPRSKWFPTLFGRLQAVHASSQAVRSDSMMELVKLYISEGMAPEAIGILELIRQQDPEYFKTNRLALLLAANQMMLHHFGEAKKTLDAEELAELPEAMLWRQAVSTQLQPAGVLQPILDAARTAAGAANSDTVASVDEDSVESSSDGNAQAATRASDIATSSNRFQFLKFNKPFIRFYPPRYRQRLSLIAAEAYLANGEEEKAVTVYDILVRDGISDEVRHDLDVALAMAARKKGEKAQAMEILDRVARQRENPRAAAIARSEAAKLRLENGSITASEAAEIIEHARLSWRGDAVEYNMLQDLIALYREDQNVADLLRTYQATLDAFPGNPNSLSMSADMTDLFQEIYLEGMAEKMDPLKALSLFYEFRALTPLGDSGDAMIQGLADRLTSVDLIEPATQLLEHQIKIRSGGEVRSRIGARLALLYLLNQQPQEALSSLEITNFGGDNEVLQRQRQRLTAQALLRLKREEEALGVIIDDRSPEGEALRLEILWSMQDWPNIVNRAEDMLSSRPNLTAPLTAGETEVLLKLALAYSFESDYVQLRYLRDYYSGLIPDSAYKQIFDFITNDTTPLDPADYALVASQISRTKGFLDTFREKIAQSKLSEVIP